MKKEEKKCPVPGFAVYTALLFAAVAVLLQLYKAGFYLYFSDVFAPADGAELRHALWISMRFDFRLSLILILLPCLLAMAVPGRFFSRTGCKRFSRSYFSAVGVLLTLLLLADTGNFSYTGERLNASLAEFAKNPLISLGMLWQSYPVVWGALGVAAVGFAFYFFASWAYRISARLPEGEKKLPKVFWRAAWVLLAAWGLYGSTTHYPLRWSEAYFSKDKNVNSLALNPVLYLFSTISSADTTVDTEAFEKYLPAMVRYLGTSPQQPFERTAPARGDSLSPNLVFVMLESFGAAPMSAFGNPLPSTPHTDSLLRECLFFKNAYVPRWGTAFTVYGSLTGIPDVTLGTTASRVQKAVDQRVLMDQAKGYRRYYLLGGSANWANIRAVFQSNVEGVRIFEEGSYPVEDRVDVWGIDDYDLFKYAATLFDSLDRAGQPFIAYLQTSSNHRPYTVPHERDGYRPLRESEVDMQALRRAGFLELGQYNALRYLDFNIARFVRRAREQGWARNTVIVFFGDHNMGLNPYTHTPRPEYPAGLSHFHVPIFVYAPSLIEPRTVEAPATLMDVMPTAFSIAGLPYTNYTLGRDMSDTLAQRDSYGFACGPYRGTDGLFLIGDSLVYARSIDGSVPPALYRYRDGMPLDSLSADSPAAARMDSLAQAFYHSARYLYFNNRKPQQNRNTL